MTIIYRTAGAWGGGTLFDLPAATIDGNFWDLHGRVEIIEAWPTPAGIDYFDIDGNQLTVVMDDYTTRGPYTLPIYVPTAFVWAPAMAVTPGQMFAQNGVIYTVIYAHTTVDPFDPAENDGGGNDYYEIFMEIDGTLPAGGTTGQVLAKSSAADQAVFWANSFVPAGGVADDVLTKVNSTNYNYAWTAAFAKPLTTQTISDATLALTTDHPYTYIRFNHATSCEVTVPANATQAIPVDSEISLHQAGTGYVEILEAGGVTVNVPDGFEPRLAGGHATATLKKVGTNEWDLIGLLQPS